MSRQIVQLATIVFASYVFAHAQQMTIPEAVRQMKPRLGSDPYVTSRIRQLSPLPYDEAVRQADVIVHAKLTELGTYLSPDQTELFTDYQVILLQVIADRGFLTGRTPGTQSSLVIRVWGGETMIDGVKVKIYDENFPYLPTNRPLLLFLMHDTQSGKFKIFDGIVGAFEIDPDNRLKHLLTPSTTPSYQRVNGAALAARGTSGVFNRTRRIRSAVAPTVLDGLSEPRSA